MHMEHHECANVICQRIPNGILIVVLLQQESDSVNKKKTTTFIFLFCAKFCMNQHNIDITICKCFFLYISILFILQSRDTKILIAFTIFGLYLYQNVVFRFLIICLHSRSYLKFYSPSPNIKNMSCNLLSHQFVIYEP